MDVDDIEGVLESGFARLRAAQEAWMPAPAGHVRGRDGNDCVEVVVDEHGLLTDIVFSDDVGELTPAELESAVLEAQRDAHQATGRATAGALPDIGSSEVSEQVRRILGLEED